MNDGGPQLTIAKIQGLKYLPQAQTVAYEAAGKQTVCAHVWKRKGLLGARLHIKNTGLCTVTAERTTHAEDDGGKFVGSARSTRFLT
jgi:hypothetical protein